jgi:hypothetical protein
MNIKWRNYGFFQAYKGAITKYYKSSRHVFSSSSEVAQSSYHKRGGTVISATDSWTRRVHKFGEDFTGAGRWSFFTMLGKDSNLVIITCYQVCPRLPQSSLGSAYYQQARIMEEKIESTPFTIDPHRQNIHTQASGSTQIDFMFMSSAAAEFVFRCGTLDFNTLFWSDHRLLYIDIDILRLLGYPVHGTIRAIECDLKLHDPRLIDAYQATSIQQLVNHNVGPMLDDLYTVDPYVWVSHHESRFNDIYRDVELAMHCAANNYRRKYLKKHTWTATFTRIIYQIRFWRLQRSQRRILENGSRCGQQQNLSFYALKLSLHGHKIQSTPSVQVCLRGIVTDKREMKTEIISQSKSKLRYQHDLTSDIIYRKHDHLSFPSRLSDKILRDDLIENKILSMN